MVTTQGKDAVIRWVEETTAGTFPTNPALKLFSKETLRASLAVDVGQQESLDMGNVDVEEYFLVQNTYDIEVECHIYDADRILDFMDRAAANNMKTYSLEYIPDVSAATKHYYRATGWRVASVELSVDANAAWVATVTFTGGVISDPVTSDPGIGTGSREAKASVSGSIKTFASGLVTLDGAAWAVLVGSFSVTMENATEVLRTMGQANPVTNVTLSATRRFSGSADISLDDGASAQWAKVKAGAAHTIEVPFGGTGEQLLTLTGVRFPSLEVESNTDDQLMMGGQDFTAASYTRGTVP